MILYTTIVAKLICSINELLHIGLYKIMNGSLDTHDDYCMGQITNRFLLFLVCLVTQERTGPCVWWK